MRRSEDVPAILKKGFRNSINSINQKIMLEALAKRVANQSKTNSQLWVGVLFAKPGQHDYIVRYKSLIQNDDNAMESDDSLL